MAEETVKQEAQNTEAKTFTQEEVNQMIQERLFRDRKDRSDYDELKKKAEEYDKIAEKSKTDLEKATERADSLQKQLDSLTKANEVRAIREKVSQATGIPQNLLSGDDEESCLAQAKQLAEFRDASKPNAYPTVPDSGEVTKIGGNSTSDQFANWLNEALKK